ncbi:regulatory protein GemA [Ottowia testudinis]|uniref:Regulatory protein GemA n=1 Tax=Ottowia testudinis TaxID=2816950 RepID=A0A975H3T8_9BURK|nr:regulatory protein GemA [Ottowia testudinis]QTD46159.1 regulatory protein GemA [Ottowia testudinis]
MAAERQPRKTRLSRNQLAVIHIARQQLGIDDPTYRALLRGAAGVTSSTELNEADFEAVMRRFGQLGFTGRKGVATSALAPHARATDGYRPGMATPAQIDTIRGMWAKWHGSDDERALSRWIERYYGISALRFCDVQTAQKAIEGLKAMNARRARLNAEK